MRVAAWRSEACVFVCLGAVASDLVPCRLAWYSLRLPVAFVWPGNAKGLGGRKEKLKLLPGRLLARTWPFNAVPRVAENASLSPKGGQDNFAMLIEISLTWVRWLEQWFLPQISYAHQMTDQDAGPFGSPALRLLLRLAACFRLISPLRPWVALVWSLEAQAAL